jgi:radical SAM protein with 4Fe4S-binding SPASM domain
MIESLVKPVNLLSAGYSYLKSVYTGNPDINSMPVSINTELTNYCNLKCPHCSSGSGLMSRRRGFMDIELFRKIMHELQPFLYYVNLYFQGEPMLHPHFFSFIENNQRIPACVSTNGHFLNEENSGRIVQSGLKKLIISVDGMDQETYSAYRVNGSLKTVTDGLHNVTLAKRIHKSPIIIEIQYLVNKFNENQIHLVKKLAREVHASLNLKSMQLINSNDISLWLPAGKRFRRYRVNHDGYVIKSELPDRCARLWFNPVITWDGKVVPCCFDKDAEYIMGDLNNDSFRDIWNGPKYRMFRKSILTGRNMIEMCRNCTSGLKGVNI